MTATPKQLETFAPIEWVTSYLNSPDWCVGERTRGRRSDEDADRYPSDVMSSYNGVQEWVELYQLPAPGSKLVTKTISLIKFGTGLNGFPGICHGGAMMTLMDESLAFAMIANETEGHGVGIEEWTNLDGGDSWRKMFREGRPLAEVLKGRLVTARLDIKFLKPVLCPGIVGVEVDMLENKGHKMKIRGVMKDGQGVPLIQADGLWVRIGGHAKL